MCLFYYMSRAPKAIYIAIVSKNHFLPIALKIFSTLFGTHRTEKPNYIKKDPCVACTAYNAYVRSFLPFGMLVCWVRARW